MIVSAQDPAPKAMTSKRRKPRALTPKAERLSEREPKLEQPSTLVTRQGRLMPLRKDHRHLPRPPFDCIALVLQGGGALGAYQGGSYQAIAEAGLEPDWLAGISIGAVNAALIAGNAPGERVDKLKAFWDQVSAPDGSDPFGLAENLLRGDFGRGLLNQFNAASALLRGAPGFFAPRLPPAYLRPAGTPGALSWYDTAPLRATLERMVDFDRINAGALRFSVGAVNVRTGNFTYFDTTTHKITAAHVMASAALPPGFPPVEIDGELYWDGGLVSNTPLQWVVDGGTRHDTLAFQVDLWSARGELPGDLGEVGERLKEIQYSSRTRANTDQFKAIQSVRATLAGVLDQLPPGLRAGEVGATLRQFACPKVYRIVQLIYRSRHYETESKDYEFSRASMRDHWDAGYHDATRTLRHPEALERPADAAGVATFDLGVDGRE
jgi:NTE family protein